MRQNKTFIYEVGFIEPYQLTPSLHSYTLTSTYYLTFVY